MSTRWYPIYTKGNPQLRVFLPNFWMKIVKPDKPLPENTVLFQTSVQMTHHDVRNYLEKIYNMTIADVKVEIKQGKTKLNKKKYVVKEDDYKVATVTLPKGEKFEYPNLFPKDAKEEMAEMEEARNKYNVYQRRNVHRPGVPGWFSF